MSRVVNVADMLHGRTWSPKQIEILQAFHDYRIICVDGGRRFGKSYICAPLFLTMRAARHQELIDQVRRGERKPWSGGGMMRKDARHEDPDMECVILTPRERHQVQCRAYVTSYFGGKKAIFRHPDMKMMDSGKEMWWYYGGVSCRVRFITGSGEAAVVSNSIDLLWIDEAGLLDNLIVEAAIPLLWERNGKLICSGTPEQGNDHWFTQRCLEGLNDDHEYYQANIVKPDPDCKTFVGTSYEAFDPQVRAAAKRDAARMGEAWERKYVLGDWRLQDVLVYDNWDHEAHVIEYDPMQRRIPGYSRPLPPPSVVYGVIDFAYSSHRPGAAVVFHIWFRNPIEEDEDHPRPLIIAVEDCQKAQEYTYDVEKKRGWIYDWKRLRDEWGVEMWYCDPSRPDMVQLAQRQSKHIGPVREASKADKFGRINIVKSWLEASGGPPAFYVNGPKCSHLPRQFTNYRRTTTAKGEVQERTTDYDDHCLDCCAFLAGKIMPGGYSRPVLPTG